MPRRQKNDSEPEVNYTSASLEMVIPKLKDCYDPGKDLEMQVKNRDVFFMNGTEFPFSCPYCGDVLVSLATQRAYKARNAPFTLWCRQGCHRTWELGTSELYSLIPSISETWKTVTGLDQQPSSDSTENPEFSDHSSEDQQTQPDPA